MSESVRIFGPNLSNAGQKKGEMHVHTEGCGDVQHYGPGTRYGGDDYDGWLIEVDSREDAVEAIYDPDEFDYDADDADDRSAYDSSVYFAPCVESKRRGEA